MAGNHEKCLIQCPSEDYVTMPLCLLLTLLLRYFATPGFTPPYTARIRHDLIELFDSVSAETSFLNTIRTYFFFFFFSATFRKAHSGTRDSAV
jgi:hypothetical protein